MIARVFAKRTANDFRIDEDSREKYWKKKIKKILANENCLCVFMSAALSIRFDFSVSCGQTECGSQSVSSTVILRAKPKKKNNIFILFFSCYFCGCCCLLCILRIISAADRVKENRDLLFFLIFIRATGARKIDISFKCTNHSTECPNDEKSFVCFMFCCANFCTFDGWTKCTKGEISWAS